MKTIKKPFTSSELFNLINKQLRETVNPTDFDFGILDYGLDTYQPVEIRSYQWDTVGIVNFGGSEGIYLDIYADGIVDDTNERKKIHLGTYKTLRDDKAAFREMGSLNAEFVFALRKFVNGHIDDFEWSGFGVTFSKTEGGYSYGYTYPDFESVQQRIIRDLSKPGAEPRKVTITDNAKCRYAVLDPFSITNEELTRLVLDASNEIKEWVLGYPLTGDILEEIEDCVAFAVKNLGDERIECILRVWKPEWKPEVQ